MRLFRRRDNEAAEATPGPEGPALGAPGAPDPGKQADDGVTRQASQPTGDWMTMAPMAPTFPSMPTTFRVQTLPEILTSHHDTRLSTSLGHAVSPEGPSGSVAGLATQAASSMSHTGDVSRSTGMGDLELREPHHAPAPDVPALEVRRLADPSPMSTSSTSMSAPASPALSAPLPAPAVSRSLLDTAPLVARPSDARPLPVARVVDAPAAAATTPTPVPAAEAEPVGSLSSEPPPDAAPLIGGDERVGGFGVGSDDPFGADAVDDVPRTTAPAELAPPIQPRRIQRRVDPAAAATRPTGEPVSPRTEAGPAPAGTGHLPLVSRLADGGAAPSGPPVGGGPGPSPATGDTGASVEPAVSRLADEPSTTPLAGDAAAPAPSADAAGTPPSVELPISRLADGPSTAPLAGGRRLSSSGAADPITADDAPPAPPAPAGGLPLAKPTVPTSGPVGAGTASAPIQRLADATPPAELDPPIQRLADATPPADIDPPISRLADTPSPGPQPASTTPGQPDLAGPSAAGGGAPLVGDEPIAATGSAVDGATPHEPDEPVAAAELPLVHPASSAPTLGADADPMVHVQPMTESAGGPSSPSVGTAALPLAPTDLGPALQPPQHFSPADGPRPPEASSSPRPLATAGPPSVQRLPTATAATRATTPSTATPTSTSTLPFVRPIGASSAGLGLQRSTGDHAPMSMLAPPSSGTASSRDLPVQLRRLAAPGMDAVATTANLAAPASSTANGSGTSPPLASLQRLDASTASAPSPSAPPVATSDARDGHAAPDLPLHTPATAIPSAADVAVRAGLAERGPGGDLFYTSPPATTSITVQRAADVGSGPGDTTVQTSIARSPMIGAHRGGGSASIGTATPGGSSATGEDGGVAGGDDKDATAEAKNLAAEAKKLYPFIRSALEADMRRQIEGKSRANRFRP